ncbi:MAG: uracil phosphoribosyltransferase [Epsilonproteobacteria bacterium]|nr:uracil phosphoribosyltransferase [Campylobacterota bacterium]
MVYELSHPIVKTLVSHLRETKTDALRFRHIVHELAQFLVYEAFKSEPLHPKNISMWQGEEDFNFIQEKNLLFVTILRAGLPMIESLTALFPDAPSGFLAMKRDESTHQSVLYYDRIPECKDKTVIIVDPMVATGGSLSDAISVIKEKSPKRILSLNIIAAPEGLEILKQKHPDIDIYIAQIDNKLNENMFIIPGLGDAGYRSYNTKK